MTPRPSLAFVHIPKNAGTSIRRAIADHGLPIKVSDHWYTHRLADEEIVVIRSPHDRFVSAFHYERRRWPNPVNSAFDNANDLACCAADPEHPRHALAWTELGNEPEHFLLRNGKPTAPHRVGSVLTRFSWIFEPQSTWLVHSPRHILRHRHVAADFRELLERLELARGIELPRENESGGREALSAEARAFLDRIYAPDFEFIRARGLDV